MSEVTISAAFPGELVIRAILDGLTVRRETMSQANRDREDALYISISENLHLVWEKIWRDTGVLPPKVNP